MKYCLMAFSVAGLIFLNCSSNSKLPNNSPCTHHDQCQSQICCGDYGHNATCSASPCTNPNPIIPLDFCSAGERPMVVTNQSSQTLWVGITSGSFFCRSNADCTNSGGYCALTAFDSQGNYGVCGCAAPDYSCGTLGTCSTNTQVVQLTIPTPVTAPAYQCFWKTPRLVDTQTTKLDTKQSLKLCYPIPAGAQSQHRGLSDSLSNVQWSGNLFARVGCNSKGQNCISGECSTNNAGCSTCGLGIQCVSNKCSGGSKNGQACSITGCGPGFTPTSGTYEDSCPNNGSCAPQNGNCNVGTGGNPPTTLAEFTFTAPSPSLDYYDVSIINGINMGVSMAPDPNTTNLSSTDPYFCGTPGSKTQSDSLGVLKSCSWTVSPSIPGQSDQSTLLRQVRGVAQNSCSLPSKRTSAGFCTCGADSDCSPGPTGQVCGLAQNADSQTSFSKVCGTAVGYWSADQICGTVGPTDPETPNGKMISPLNCNQTNFDLFACTGTAATSCYQTGTSCTCGCPTSSDNPYLAIWPKVLSSQGNCNATSPLWVDNAQPWLVFMKAACPTAYTFPFDDKTSTFTCHAKSGVPVGSGPGYYVTFFDTTYQKP